MKRVKLQYSTNQNNQTAKVESQINEVSKTKSLTEDHYTKKNNENMGVFGISHRQRNYKPK